VDLHCLARRGKSKTQRLERGGREARWSTFEEAACYLPQTTKDEHRIGDGPWTVVLWRDRQPATLSGLDRFPMVGDRFEVGGELWRVTEVSDRWSSDGSRRSCPPTRRLPDMAHPNGWGFHFRAVFVGAVGGAVPRDCTSFGSPRVVSIPTAQGGLPSKQDTCGEGRPCSRYC